MSLVTVPQNNPNDEITALSVNQGPNAIATVVNGQLDDTNIATLSGSKISSGSIPNSALDTNANAETRLFDIAGDFVASGVIWSATTGLAGTQTSGVAYINGKRLVVAAVASHTFTASKDTYVSLDSTGTPTYQEVTNGGAAPTLAANSIFTAKVVTSGSAVTSVTDLRRPSTANFGNPAAATYINTGAGGGTGYYVNLGGLKICWGKSGTFTSTTNTPYTISLPVGFFTNVRSAVTDLYGSGTVVSRVGDSITTSLITIFFATATAGNSLTWIVIGD